MKCGIFFVLGLTFRGGGGIGTVNKAVPGKEGECMASNRIDATRGAIVPQILRYSYPLILSTLVQSLFSAVDVAVLGNMADSNAVASVGATGAVTGLLVNAFVGFSSGTKILLARFIGARDQEKIRSTADTAVLLSLLCGLLVAALGWFLSPAILRLTSVRTAALTAPPCTCGSISPPRRPFFCTISAAPSSPLPVIPEAPCCICFWAAA